MIQNTNTTSKRQAIAPLKGRHYNWIGQPERLVYMGTTRYPGDRRTWHKFAKVTTPNVCYSEVLTSELVMLEETEGSQMTTTPTIGAADLLTLIEAYAEARRCQGHSSYNAQTATALQAVKDALAQRFDAADMATAAAQGFRDGAASITVQAADLPEALRRSTAADGKTELFNLPGYPLMVRAVDFNRIHTESEMRRTALLDEMQKAALAAGQATAAPAGRGLRGDA